MKNKKLPFQGYCFLMKSSSPIEETINLSKVIKKLVDYCCDNTIPHNLFFTYGATTEEIRIFFYVRSRKHLGRSDTFDGLMMVAFSEFSGYFSVSNEEFYEGLNEDYILRKIQEEVDDVFAKTEEEILKLYNSETQ
jgi:GDP-D-glucose phosphorylase